MRLSAEFIEVGKTMCDKPSWDSGDHSGQRCQLGGCEKPVRRAPGREDQVRYCSREHRSAALVIRRAARFR